VVLNVAGVDYRLRVLKQAQLFKSPLTDDNKVWMAKRFNALTIADSVRRTNYD
jgi:cell division protein ZapE